MDNNQKPAAILKILAGGTAGVSETLVTYPAEFLKTRRQLRQNKQSSLIQIARSTYQSRGLAGFYSGCGALAISNAFKSGVRFYSFEATRDYLDIIFETQPGKRRPLVSVLSGLSAGIAESVLVVTPGESIKTRMVQSSELAQTRGVFPTTMNLVRTEGIKVLWQGLGPVLLKQGTNSAVRFSTFGILQEKFNTRYPLLKGKAVSTLAVGAASGVVTVYVSMPFDNIKTRMQSKGEAQKSMMGHTKQIFQDGGISGFWRGTAPRLVRLTLSSAITFTVYDQLLQASKKLQIPSLWRSPAS